MENRIIIESEDIVKMCCEYYRLEPSDVFKNSRKRTFMIPRQVIQYFHTKYTTMSYENIGKITPIYGRKQPHDHSSITHSKQTIIDLLETGDKGIIRDIVSLENGFKMLFKDSTTGKPSKEARKQMLSMELINQRIELIELKERIKSLENGKIISKIPETDYNILLLLKDMDYTSKRESLLILETKKKVSERLNKSTAA